MSTGIPIRPPSTFPTATPTRSVGIGIGMSSTPVAGSASSSSSKTKTKKPTSNLSQGPMNPSSSTPTPTKTTPGGSTTISRKDKRKGLQGNIVGGGGVTGQASSSFRQNPGMGFKRVNGNGTRNANGNGHGSASASPGSGGKWHKNKSGSDFKGLPRSYQNQPQRQSQHSSANPSSKRNQTSYRPSTPSSTSTPTRTQDQGQDEIDVDTPDSTANSPSSSAKKSSAKRNRRREKKKNRTGTYDGVDVMVMARGDEGGSLGSVNSPVQGSGSPGSLVRGLGGSGSKSSSGGGGEGEGQARVDVQDEAGRSIGLGSQDMVPHLSALIKLVSDRLGLDKTRTGLRLVHLRGQGQVVPIFDQPDYQYFLERSRLGGVGSQVLQVQVYLKEIVRSGSGFGSGSRVGEKKRKRSDSSGESENDEDDSDEDAEDEEPVQRVTKSVSNKLAGRDGKREPVVQSASTNPSPAQKNKMDQPFSSTPSSSSLTDPTTSDPDSPSPAPRRNIIHLGSRFKPAKPSPLGGTVVARSPTASIGTNGSDGEDEDVVMEDVVAAVPPSPAVAGKKGKKGSKSATPSSEKKKTKKQTTAPPASSDLDGFARAISEFAAMLPSMTTNASSSSSSSPEDHAMNALLDVDTDDDEDVIGDDTILDDDSGITQAEATQAYERYKEQKAREAEASKREQEMMEEKKRVEAEAAEQKRQKKAEAEQKRQEKAEAADRKRQEKAEAEQKRNEKAELEAKKKEEAARRKLEAEEALRKKAEEERVQIEELEREREVQQETKMQAARLELEALTTRLAEKGRLAAQASGSTSSQIEVVPDAMAGSSGTVAKETDDGSVSPDTESESGDPTSPEDVMAATPDETAQQALTPRAAAALVASPIAPVVVAPASQEVEEGDSSSSEDTSSGSDEESSSSDEDDAVKITSTPDPTPLQAIQAVTSIPRPAHLPSSSPEPYSDIEDVEDEAPRQQKNRRRTQRSPSTDAHSPEGDDDDDDDASSIEATQPLIQLSQLLTTQEDIETADERDERDDQMEVDVVEDFPLSGPRVTETEALALARQTTPELTDPDATEDEDEEDHSPQNMTPIANVEETSPQPSVQASPVSKPAVPTTRASRRSFADLADDIEASSSAVPSTGNQVFFQALQTEADVDEAGIRDAASEMAVRNESAESLANGDDQLVSDEAAVVQESQSDSMPDSTPTPAPNSRKSKLKAKEALIAQAAELAALNADPRNDDESRSSKSTHDADVLPMLRTDEESAAPEPSAAATSQTHPAEEVASSMEIEVPIAPLPKRRGRPPKARAPNAASAGSQNSNTAGSSQAASSSQDTQREVVGSSISPKLLAFQEAISPPASVTAQLPALPLASEPSLLSTSASASASASPSTAAPPARLALSYQRKEDLRSRRRVGTKPCLICDSIPAHLQKDCPVVIRGLPSVEKRLKELKDTGASSMTIDALQGWVVRLSNKSQQVNKSASPVGDTPNKTNAAHRANGSQASVASTMNGTTTTNGTPLSKRRPGVATRNNIPTLSSLRADALRKPRLAGGISKDAATTPTVEKASPFLRRGKGSDDEESSSGTDSDSDDDGKGPALPASLAGRMANGIKTAKKAAVGAIGW